MDIPRKNRFNAIALRAYIMRRGGRHNERVVLPLFDEPLGISHSLGVRFVIGDRKIDDRLAQHAPYARFARLIRNGVLKIVHVAIRRRPAAYHFSQTEPRAGPDKLLCNVFGLSREDELSQPVVQVQIVRDTAK